MPARSARSTPSAWRDRPGIRTRPLLRTVRQHNRQADQSAPRHRWSLRASFTQRQRSRRRFPVRASRTVLVSNRAESEGDQIQLQSTSCVAPDRRATRLRTRTPRGIGKHRGFHRDPSRESSCRAESAKGVLTLIGHATVPAPPLPKKEAESLSCLRDRKAEIPLKAVWRRAGCLVSKLSNFRTVSLSLNVRG